ncbi:helix-turn-helix domain-containing protein [Aquimarina litoralis]|uniref:helix-turn-helix domain-containing protein n=1 Tax=Aquimarina litoralis TaxID=584605 RepID=UPI001C592332|nr:helix-turn-helix transcriptional regulator [Aquimarina litoralis]MBW1294830.1 helix-turn-helix domain-containing protein [Aquimarina litoralis]
MSKLAEYRLKLNLTQEELSKKSGISVRTIQRVESGIKPKGFTLKTLARALEIKEKDLIQKDDVNLNKEYNFNIIKLINLSSLIAVFIPVVNFVLPLIIAIVKKQLNSITKQIITIQILWTVIMIFVYLFGSLIFIDESSRDIGIAVLLLLVISNVFIILRNGIELNKTNKLHIDLKFSII